MTTDRRAVLAGAVIASLAGLSSAKAAPRAPVAVTRYGKVRGGEVDGVKVFKGVRYGADTGPRLSGEATINKDLP